MPRQHRRRPQPAIGRQRQRPRIKFVLIAFGIARIKPLIVAEIVIAAHVVLIGVVLRARRIEIIVRIVLAPGNVRVGIKFEDGRREIKKSRDGALRLLRRATGASEAEEANRDRGRSRDTDIDQVMRSDMRRRW